MGESRGRWEGNTLVVTTTNYKEGPSNTNIGVAGSPPGNRFPVSDQMKTTERFTRLNNEMWLYEIKTEDPVVMTRPYTVRFPMRNDPTYDWWEYACHEGNSVIPNYVTTSRFERANPQPASPRHQLHRRGRRPWWRRTRWSGWRRSNPGHACPVDAAGSRRPGRTRELM